MSVNDRLEDGFTRHQIFVQRYAKGREREAQRYIQRLIGGVVDRLGSQNLTQYSRARLERLLADLNLYMSQLGTEYSDQVIEEMARFAEYESEFTFDLLGQNVIADLALPSPTQVQAAIYTDVMSLEPTKGYTIRDALSEFSTRKQNQIVQQIRDGVVLGQTIDQVAASITSLAPVQRRQAATLARTITNRVSIKARETTMRENDDVVEAYKWVATLDSHTSIICMGRDGTLYQDNDKNPKPPAHFNCRSTITYVVKPEFDLGADIPGERPAVGPDGKITQVKDSTNYSTWLRRQPESFQDEVLGPGRAALFRKGTLPLDRFVDENGRELTLTELRALDRQTEGTGTAPTPAEEVAPGPPPSPPEPAPIPAFTFADVEIRGKKTAKQWDDAMLPNLTEAQKLAVARANKPSFVSTEKSGVYYSHTKRVYAKKIDKKDPVVTHEYGHHIDYEMNNEYNETQKGAGIFSNIKARSEIDQKFKDALRADASELFEKAGGSGNFAMRYKEEYFERYKKRANSRYYYQRPKSHAEDMQEAGISDIIDAMMGGSLQSTYKLWGHGKSYYRRPGSREKETFANLFALANQDTERGRRARKWFPRLFKRFEEMLDEYNRGVIK
jgi:SPP1 gp7 family putative phage head morphogenesis protein